MNKSERDRLRENLKQHEFVVPDFQIEELLDSYERLVEALKDAEPFIPEHTGMRLRVSQTLKDVGEL